MGITLPTDPPASRPFILLNDQPANGDGDRDVLGTREAAVHLAELIVASRFSTPFTLGIDAGWGMGKSSLMLQVQERLKAKADSGIEAVWFNAWTAEGAGALDGLIKSVLLSLDENVLRRGLRKIISKRQLMAGARILFIIIASYFHLTRVADEIWNRLSVDARSRNNIRTQMSEIFQQWSTKTKRSPNGRTMVVFIDDLDRCSNDVILEICEAMKLYLDVQGIAFVVGCDQAVLGQAALSAGGQSQNVANASYLEKIIQVTYTKPMPFDDQVEQLINSLARRSGTEAYFTDSVKRIVMGRSGKNPRRIKRLINSFVLEYSLDPGWAEFGAEALIVIILIRHFYPDFYTAIANPAANDIATEFLMYFDIRSNVHLGRAPSEEERRYFQAHLVRAPGEQYVAEDLLRLEQELPVTFPRVVRDIDFVALLRTLSNREDFDRLQRRLQRHPISSVISSEISAPFVAHLQEERDLTGLRVLWIDDQQEAVRYERDVLLALGVTVQMVTSGAEARSAIAERLPHVLISGITRQDDTSAALADLRAMRAAGIYSGPTVFYTDRVTPSRQRVADALKTFIATSPDALVEYLRTYLAGPVPDQDLIPTTGLQPTDPIDGDAAWPVRQGRDTASRWLTGEL
jgi:CheY-like chemotaxis protein